MVNKKYMYISWANAVKLSLKLASIISLNGYRPDAIIAISRGGLVPARIVSDALNIEEVYSVKASLWGITGRKYRDVHIAETYLPIKRKKILIIDDVVDSGKTIKRVVKYIKKYDPSDIATGVLHVKPTAKYMPDYFSEKLEKWIWIIYPWTIYETIFSIVFKETQCRIAQLSDEEILDYFSKETAVDIENYFKEFINVTRIPYINTLCSEYFQE